MRIDLYIHNADETNNTQLLQRIAAQLDRMEAKENTFMASASQALTDVQNAVASEQTVEQSAITLIQQLAAQVTAANGVSPDAVEAVVAQIQANASALAQAVTANTPASGSGPTSQAKRA